MGNGRLFDPDPEQLAIELHSVTRHREHQLKTVELLHDQVQAGFGDHDLIPDDQESLSRIVQLHSLDKDYYAYRYADIVSRAMRGKFPAIWWIELFAGPGRLYCAPEDRFYDGSPIRAMQVTYPYDGYFFNDVDPECVRSLAARTLTHPNVKVTQGDANSPAVLDQISEVVPHNALVVLYGDPAGLDLHFETLAFLAARYPHLDLLLNFPVKGIIRALRGEHARAATKPGAVPDYRKVSAVLGYADPLELVSGSNRTWGPTIRQFFQNRLAGLGYKAFETKPIALHTNGVAVYDLMIAGHHERTADLFRKAGETQAGGQYTFDLG